MASVSQNASRNRNESSKTSEKDEDEAPAGNSSLTVVTDSKNANDKLKHNKEDSSSLMQIFEVISKLRLTLDKTVNIVFASPSSPLPSLKDRGTYPIKIIEKVDIGLSEWRDEPNDVRYIITEYGDKIEFNNITSLMTAIIRDYRVESQLALTAMKEPKRKLIHGVDRVYDPDSMGFPFSELREGMINDRYRVILSELFAGAAVPNAPAHFSRSRVFDYPPRAQTRQNVITHAIGNSGVINNLKMQAVGFSNASLGLQNPDVKHLTNFETVLPTYPFNAFSGILDAMPSAAYIARYEIVTEISGFSISLDPISAGDLLKSAGANATRATWLSDLTSTSYRDEMSPEITGLFASLVVPGEVLIELDFSDIPDNAIELRGIASMGAYLFGMYDENSTFINMSRTSIITIQRGIVRLGLQNNVFRQSRIGGEWPLDDVDYANGPIQDLDGFRVIDGVAGINQGGRFQPNDALANLFPGCGNRINYAIDMDDRRQFDNEVHGCDQWPIFIAMRNFVAKNRNLGYVTSYFNVIARRMLGFYVAVNQHNKTHWYSAFRSTLATQNARHYDDIQGRAVRVPVKGKTLLHLMRSLSGEGVKENYTFEEILNLSSGGIRVMSEFAAEMSIIDLMINDLGVDAEFSPNERLRLIDSPEPLIKYLLDLGSHYNEVRHLCNRWLNQFLNNNPLIECFEPLRLRRINDFTVKGVLPRIVARLNVNGFTREYIEEQIQRHMLYINVYEGPARVTDSRALIRHIENRRFNSVLYQSAANSLLIEIPVPFVISHALSDAIEKYCISVNDRERVSQIKSRVDIHPFVLYVLSFDPREYACDDNYTPSPINVQTNFARAADIRNVVATIDDFFADVNRRTIPITLICNDRHEFIRV
nr:TPA_asm: VP3 [Aedes orbi-like virus]